VLVEEVRQHQDLDSLVPEEVREEVVLTLELLPVSIGINGLWYIIWFYLLQP